MKKSDDVGFCNLENFDPCKDQKFLDDKLCLNKCDQCPSWSKLTMSSIKKTDCPSKVVNNQRPVACWELNLGENNDKETVYFYPHKSASGYAFEGRDPDDPKFKAIAAGDVTDGSAPIAVSIIRKPSYMLPPLKNNGIDFSERFTLKQKKLKMSSLRLMARAKISL